MGDIFMSRVLTSLGTVAPGAPDAGEGLNQGTGCGVCPVPFSQVLRRVLTSSVLLPTQRTPQHPTLSMAAATLRWALPSPSPRGQRMHPLTQPWM